MGRYVGCLMVCVCTLASFVSTQAVTGNVINFKMTCGDTELQVGDTATISVWGWVDSDLAVAGNGLDTWQMDVGVDNGGIVSISGLTMIAPDPDTGYPSWDALSLNNPVGSVSGVNVVQKVLGAYSDTGVGAYSELFTFQIDALAVGTVEYSLGGDFFAFLADGSLFENAAGSDGSVFFDEAASDNIFNVVATPEPCSILLLGMGCMALRRRS